LAGEISSANITIKYAVEATANVRPTSGYAEKTSGGTLKIAEYVTGISGLTADFDQYDVTPLAETRRHRYVKGLQSNDGNLSLSCNINPTSRNDWNAIVAEYAALTGGKGMWFEFTLPGDTQSVFFRGEPCEMGFPDVEAAQAVQGAVQIIENQYSGWTSKSST
jgi:hypothetical protein